ncbi:MAG: hypothetical protein O2800_01385 [Planctomycetota bacterium]|nr:hypothetical protein [Planctomycetota bacterium]
MPSSETRSQRANLVLTLSACGLAAALGSLLAQPTINSASADAIIGATEMSMVTLTNGQGGIENPYETLYIIDSRSEMLFIYYVENISYKRLDFRQAVSLQQLFRQARGS